MKKKKKQQQPVFQFVDNYCTKALLIEEKW